MPEATCTPFRFVQDLYFLPYRLLMTCNHHLCNTFPIFNDKRLSRKIHQDNTNLPTIIGINCSGRIQDSNPFLQSQSAPRTNLRFKSLWKSDKQSCRNQTPLHRI